MRRTRLWRGALGWCCSPRLSPKKQRQSLPPPTCRETCTLRKYGRDFNTTRHASRLSCSAAGLELTYTAQKQSNRWISAALAEQGWWASHHKRQITVAFQTKIKSPTTTLRNRNVNCRPTRAKYIARSKATTWPDMEKHSDSLNFVLISYDAAWVGVMWVLRWQRWWPRNTALRVWLIYATRQIRLTGII